MRLKSLSALVLALSCLGLTSYAFDNDVIAVWMLDEGEGDVVRDITGNGHDGTIMGAKWVNGKFGKALEFDGTSDFIEVPHNDALNLET